MECPLPPTTPYSTLWLYMQYLLVGLFLLFSIAVLLLLVGYYNYVCAYCPTGPRGIVQSGYEDVERQDEDGNGEKEGLSLSQEEYEVGLDSNDEDEDEGVGLTGYGTLSV